jgi:ABC-type nitrate/sulfonate/bicarbonate transport system substrate-binding protein
MRNAEHVRIVYRSQKITIPLLAAIEAADGWEQEGLIVDRLDYVSGAAESDPMLITGDVDFIFGSHISPYIHRANGVPMVCLGQTVNFMADALVTREPVFELGDLRGGVFAELKTKNSHPWRNHQLYLMRAGVDLTEVSFVQANDHIANGHRRTPYELVADGLADAAIVMPPSDVRARQMGLTVQPLPLLPMVQATTLTTMWDVRHNRAEMCRRVIRAVRRGVRYFTEQPAAMLTLLDSLGEQIGEVDKVALQRIFEINCQLLEPSLYPTVEAIENAFRLAVLQEPSIQGKVNPLELWDTDLLREVDAG